MTIVVTSTETTIAMAGASSAIPALRSLTLFMPSPPWKSKDTEAPA
jgi:hypothetical protein